MFVSILSGTIVHIFRIISAFGHSVKFAVNTHLSWLLYVLNGNAYFTLFSDIDEIFTCYGPGCETGSFSSPGWPTQVYANRYGALYLLYIPNAARIDFTFSSPFAIETLKDELYVGPGLSFTQDQLDGQTVENDHYFFEGSAIPAGFSVESDTVWMAFLTDKNVQLNGFQINWASVGKCVYCASVHEGNTCN